MPAGRSSPAITSPRLKRPRSSPSIAGAIPINGARQSYKSKTCPRAKDAASCRSENFAQSWIKRRRAFRLQPMRASLSRSGRAARPCKCLTPTYWNRTPIASCFASRPDPRFASRDTAPRKRPPEPAANLGPRVRTAARSRERLGLHEFCVTANVPRRVVRSHNPATKECPLGPRLLPKPASPPSATRRLWCCMVSTKCGKRLSKPDKH